MRNDNILLVDDDPGAIQLMARILSNVGSLRFATSGEDALRLARESAPDLLLLDTEMPGLSGFETCRALKADPALADVPVIFVTSHGEAAFEVSGFELGAADFIAKPVSPPLLLARVKTQLRVKRLSDELRRIATVDGLSPAERDLQQRQLLEHRHRREGRHPDLQRRRRAHAGLHGRRRDEQDHAGRHLRSAGSDRARQGAERELGTPITPGFEALVFKASRGIEDIYELTYIRKDGSRFPAVVSVTALRDAQDAIIGYLLIGTDNTARKQAEEALLKAGPCRARSSTAPTSRASPPTPRASSRSSTSAPSACWATRPPT
jgi:DNA-binding response OmpR family regulator